LLPAAVAPELSPALVVRGLVPGLWPAAGRRFAGASVEQGPLSTGLRSAKTRAVEQGVRSGSMRCCLSAGLGWVNRRRWAPRFQSRRWRLAGW